MRELLSVIIPVYNTEHTLERTVQSVQNQTWDNIEIILVDDCSPDNAGELCDKLAELDNSIKVIHKLNEGLGLTRNAGLRTATGKYVAFLDSDDWLENDTYEKCITALEDNNADACYYGRKVYKADGSFSVVDNIPIKNYFNDEEVVGEFAPRYFGDWSVKPEEVYIRESSCCALYRKSLIDENNIAFMSEREVLSEDIFFNLDVCRVARAVLIIPENMYNQGFNPGSLTRKRDITRFRRSANLYATLMEYSQRYPEINNSKMRIKYRLISLIRGLIRDEVSACQTFREAFCAVNNMISESFVQEIYSDFDASLVDKKTKLFISWVKGQNTLLICLLYWAKSKSK